MDNMGGPETGDSCRLRRKVDVSKFKTDRNPRQGGGIDAISKVARKEKISGSQKQQEKRREPPRKVNGKKALEWL